MVAIKAHAVDRFVGRPDPAITAFLVYGPDRGLVSERCRKLLHHFAKSPDDPFSVSILDEADIAKSADPLIEELNAIAFGAERRTVFVRSGSGAAPATLVKAVAAPREGILVVEAGDLKPGSAARKAFEGAKSAATLPCYSDGPAALGDLIDKSLATFQQTITAEARQDLMGRLGADRLASRAEIEKLMLYAGEGASITASDVDAATADASELDLDALIDAVFEGSPEGLEQKFDRCLHAGMAPARILAAAIRHALRLHQLCVAAQGGASPERAISNLRPPVFFRRKDSHLRQMRRWSETALRRALALLAEAEIDGRLGLTPEASASRVLLRLTLLPKPGLPKPGRR